MNRYIGENNMKNVLLIGDSIRMGYDKSIKQALEGRANVVFPEDNCQFACYVFRYFHEWFGGIDGRDFDVIHWNAGLHDVLRLFEEEPTTPLEVYEYYIERICVRMKKLCPNAKIIFATSTSVISEKMTKDFMRYNEDIERYNAAAVKIVTKHGFEVNDLYALSKTLPEEAHSDAVHYYTDMGTQAYSKQVLSYIEAALGNN